MLGHYYGPDCVSLTFNIFVFKKRNNKLQTIQTVYIHSIALCKFAPYVVDQHIVGQTEDNLEGRAPTDQPTNGLTVRPTYPATLLAATCPESSVVQLSSRILDKRLLGALSSFQLACPAQADKLRTAQWAVESRLPTRAVLYLHNLQNLQNQEQQHSA